MLNEDFPDCGDGADAYDGYAAFNEIVRSVKDGNLALIDPFSKFLRDKAPDVVPRMAEMAGRAAVLLFALNLCPNNQVGRRFDKLLTKHLPGAWRMTCPPLHRNTGVRGESMYHAEVVLAARELQDHADGRDGATLRMRLDEFTWHLAAALGLRDDCLEPRIVG